MISYQFINQYKDLYFTNTLYLVIVVIFIISLIVSLKLKGSFYDKKDLIYFNFFMLIVSFIMFTFSISQTVEVVEKNSDTTIMYQTVKISKYDYEEETQTNVKDDRDTFNYYKIVPVLREDFSYFPFPNNWIFNKEFMKKYDVKYVYDESN